MVLNKQNSFKSGGTEYTSYDVFTKKAFLCTEQGTNALDSIKVRVSLDTEVEEGILRECKVEGAVTILDAGTYKPKALNLYFNSTNFNEDIIRLNTLIDTLQEFKEAMFDAQNKKEELETENKNGNNL